jgi:hypothetical protein
MKRDTFPEESLSVQRRMDEVARIFDSLRKRVLDHAGALDRLAHTPHQAKEMPAVLYELSVLADIVSEVLPTYSVLRRLQIESKSRRST